MIFAPHPDDETLACGGVAVKKIRAGADVRFVFVTDGATSHVKWIAADQLRAKREKEALEAVRRLGALPESAHFLRLPDGAAGKHREQMTEAVLPLLRKWRPESVYVPHAGEPPADHVAVNLGVREAVRLYGAPTTVFEYPIWYLHHWPWVRIVGDRSGMWRAALKQTVRTVAGLRALTAFNSRAYVGDVLDAKIAALAAHETQVRRPDGQEDWPVLSDVSRGDFIARLMRDHELFARQEVNI